MYNKVLEAKVEDWEHRKSYLYQESEIIFNNTPETKSDKERYTIAWNVAKWNLDKQLEQLVNQSKKDGLRDVESILLGRDGEVKYLTRSGKLYMQSSTSLTGYKEIL